MSLFRGMLHIVKSISFCKFILFSFLTKCPRGRMKWRGCGLVTSVLHIEYADKTDDLGLEFCV